MADDELWDEHASWIALLDDPPIDTTALVDRLTPAFAAHNRQARDDIKCALVPVVEHTLHLHDAVHDDILPRRTHALAHLNDATIRFEIAARHDLTDTQSVYDNSKRTLDALFAALDDLLCESDRLFQTFKFDMHEHVQHLRRCADQIPVDAERLVTSLDDRARHLGAQDHAKAKESLLRGILEKY